MHIIILIEMDRLSTNTLAELVSTLDYDDIISYCKTNYSLFQICNNVAFWNRLISIKYGVRPKLVPGRTSREKFAFLNELKGVDFSGDPNAAILVVNDIMLEAQDAGSSLEERIAREEKREVPFNLTEVESEGFSLYNRLMSRAIVTGSTTVVNTVHQALRRYISYVSSGNRIHILGLLIQSLLLGFCDIYELLVAGWDLGSISYGRKTLVERVIREKEDVTTTELRNLNKCYPFNNDIWYYALRNYNNERRHIIDDIRQIMSDNGEDPLSNESIISESFKRALTIGNQNTIDYLVETLGIIPADISGPTVNRYIARQY